MIRIMFKGVSTSGTSNIIIRIGDAGGFETSGYSSYGAILTISGLVGVNSTTGFITRGNAASNTKDGTMTLTLENSSSNSWTETHATAPNATQGEVGGGGKSLSAELTQVRITTVNGTDTFDAGEINIQHSS